jgi:hypothetical protein
MAQASLVPALCSLCELDPPEITGQGIQASADRAAFTALAELGALVHVGNSESVLCFGCDRPHSMTVEYVGEGQYRGYCANSGYQSVKSKDIRRLMVCDDWIVLAVRSSLRIGADPRNIATTAVMLTSIGRVRFGPYPCEFFFGRRLFERARFEEAGRTVAKLVGKAPTILLTSTPRDLIPGEPPPRAAFIALEDVLQVTADNTSFNEEPVLAALRGGDRRFQSDGIGFAFSPGFRSAVFKDQEYSFSDKQAQVIEVLYEAWRSGVGRLHQTEIQGQANTSQRVGQLFAAHPAYGVLIKHNGAGYYWLDL